MKFKQKQNCERLSEACRKKKVLFLIVIITSILCVNLISASFTGAAPEFEFRFEDNVDDTAGASFYNETLGTGSSVYETGKVGRALNVTADRRDLINDSSGISYAGTDNWTVMFWVKPIVEWDNTIDHWLFVEDGDLNAGPRIAYDESGFEGELTCSGAIANPDNTAQYVVDITADWHHVICQYDHFNILIWYDGVNVANETSSGAGSTSGDGMFVQKEIGGSDHNNWFDEFKYFNYSMNASQIGEIYTLENEGTHYLEEAVGAGVTITLTAPVDEATFSATSNTFEVSYTASASNLSNSTYYIWDSDLAVFNNSVFVDLNGTSNSSSELIDNLIIGNYEWNVLTCFQNDTFGDCSWQDSNFSFSVGATIHDINYTFSVLETSSQMFTANITILEGSELSLAQLFYNGTFYEVSNITTTGNTLFLSMTIDVPLNPHPFQNTTNNFKFSFTYTDVSSTNQNTSNSIQNVSFINFQLCNATYNTQAINFSLKDEITGTLIDASSNSTNVQASFNYWLGKGSVFKNYSFERLTNTTANAHELCIFPNQTYRVDMNMIYSAATYDERTYVLRNASITNITSIIDLLLLFENFATKFTIEVRQGVTNLKGVVITVAKFFTGEGIHKTISIRETDEVGEFVEYLDLDNSYRYSVVKDGVLLGIIDKQATCTEAPCKFTLQIVEDPGNLFAGLDQHFASGVFSNLSFDIDTKIFTYEFIDITGLAQFFRLRVNQGAYNGTGVEICNEQVFSSSGSITCNVTGYEGNFVAIGTISRSPELITDILETALDALRDSLGLMAIVISFGIILTLSIAGGVLSGGNPSMVLGGFGLGIMATKLMTILPFSWVLVVLFELIILVIMGWLKT